MAISFAQLIDLAINTAIVGTDLDNNPLLKQSLEAQGIADQSLQALATMVAENPELRARLEQRFTVTLASGIGTIPAGMLVEFAREGAVRNSDGSNNGLGSFLAKVNRFSNFIQDQNSALGLYCIVNNQIYARDPGSSDYTSATGPLVIDAPFFPTKADMGTTVEDELANELVEMLARRLKGMIATAESVT